MLLSEIKRDERFEGFLIVRSAEQRAAASGKNYLDMTLADRSGSINAKMWDGTIQPPVAGSIVKVRATGNEFNGRMQLRVEKIRAAEEKLEKQLEKYDESSSFYLSIDSEGYLCLNAEIIIKYEGTFEGGGCGIDHDHKFFTERICSLP